MKSPISGVCGGDHRIAITSLRGEVARYWKTPAILATAVAAGIAFALPVVSLHGRLALAPLAGGDLGLRWRAGVQPPAATQQQAVDALGGLLIWSAVGTLAVATITILIFSLAREAERSGETAVRRAVGARPRIVLGSALLEGGLVALAGVVGGGMAGAVVAAAMPEWPGTLRPAALGWSGFAAAALVLVVLAGVSFPVLFPRRRIGEAEPHSPTPLTPSAIQVGASLVALTMGALLARHAGDLMATRAATPADGVVYSIALADVAPAERARRYATLLHRLGGDGEGEASLTSPGALLGLGPVSTVTTDCGQCSEGGLPIRWRVKPATHRLVSADTFQMLGMTLVEGRGITSRDAWGAARVAVINRSLAAREFQNGEAIGRGIRVVDDGDTWSTVVGVVDEPPLVGLGGGMQPRYSVYLSVLQHPPAAAELLTTPGGRTRELLPGRPATPVSAIAAGQAAPLSWFAAQFGLQGWAMLAIAALGSLAVTRLWVSSLLGELGVRRAIGARRGQTVGYVLSRAVAVCSAGIGGGVWFGQAIWTVLADFVPGLDPWDAGIVVGFAAVLLLSTVLGALPPAWRAARATPGSLLSAS